MAKTARQTARQWIVTHEWMVNPMQQTEWIEGQGVLIWLAEVFSSLGTGALAGWLIVVGLKLPLHFLYLGRPWRFWRAMPPFTKAWRTSWIARGTFFSVVFSGLGVCQLASSWIMPGSAVDILAKVLAGFFCLLTGIYCGFAMSYCKSLPFWNTGLLPIVITNAGIADGLALLIGVGMITGGVNFAPLENVTRILLLANALLIFTYILNGFYRSTTGWYSSRQLMTGRAALPFWIATILLGTVVPLGISLQSLWSDRETAAGLMILAVAAHTCGAFGLKYCILKVGYYEPILPKAKILGKHV